MEEDERFRASRPGLNSWRPVGCQNAIRQASGMQCLLWGWLAWVYGTFLLKGWETG